MARPDVDFVGRGDALTELERALRAVPSVVLVEGEAGIGKTRLVEEFLALHGLEHVLRASGTEQESSIDYGVADQLLRAAGTPLLGAGDPRVVVVGVDLMARFEALDAVVIDDAQWIDGPSMRVLLFALRRLTRVGPLAVFIARDDEGERLPVGLRKLPRTRTVRLSPLSDKDTAALAGISLSGFASRRLWQHTRGNPGHVLALVEEVPARALEDPAWCLPAPIEFAAEVARRLALLSPQAATEVRAASVLGEREQLGVLAALTRLEGLDEAVDSGLLNIEGMETSFAHPLTRLVVYQGLAPGQRSQLHLAAAGAVSADTARLRHRAAAATTFDEGLGGALEACARTEAASERWDAAHALLMGASRISPPGRARERRFLEALDALLFDGQEMKAAAFADELAALPDSARRDYIEARLASSSDDLERAAPLLASAWEGRDPTDTRLSTSIAYQAAIARARELDGEHAIVWAQRAGSTAVHALGLILVGRSRSAEHVLDAAPATDRRARVVRGWLRLIHDDVPGALADLRATAYELAPRDRSNLGRLIHALLGEAEHAAGLWTDAAVHVNLALEVQGGDAWSTASDTAIMLALERGAVDAAKDLLQGWSERSTVSARDAVLAAQARARVAFEEGEWSGVLDALAHVASRPPDHPVNEPGLFGWADLYASALLSDGRLSEADAFLTPRERLANDRDRRSAIVKLARVRGRLEAAQGRPEIADRTFQLALEHVRDLRMPYELALTQLAYGQFLRRAGRRRVAVQELELARTVFDALDARPALERCTRELAASGLGPMKRGERDHSQLTPQEDAVARLAGAGLSNRQIASELALSVKTVEIHLTRVYAKLGISSRRELTAGGQREP